MSTTYNIEAGDTLEKVSKKVFGTEIHSGHIFRSNPGISTTLVTGTSLTIPPLPEYPGDLPKILGIDGSNNVQIYIDGKRFEFWDDLVIKRSIDSLDVISFTAPFEYDAPGFRETFVPFSYKPLRVLVGNDVLLTGTILANKPAIDAERNVIQVSGYSLPGVLNDCMASSNSYPLEFKNVTLKDIARAISKPFGLSVDFQSDPGDVFTSVKLKPHEKPLSFLSDLARKRNLIVSSTNNGKLRFWNSKPALDPVSNLEVGKSPLLDVVPEFNEQDFFSHVTGLSFAATGVPGEPYTDKNPYLEGVYRPFTFGASNTDNSNIKVTVGAKVGRMYANMASFTVNVSTWRTKQRGLWEPNTTVQLFAPQAMIYKPFKFLIRSVELKRTSNSETATLNLILPGSFAGKAPESLPWLS